MTTTQPTSSRRMATKLQSSANWRRDELAIGGYAGHDVETGEAGFLPDDNQDGPGTGTTELT